MPNLSSFGQIYQTIPDRWLVGWPAGQMYTMYIHTQTFTLPKDDIWDGAPIGKGNKMEGTNHIKSYALDIQILGQML